MANQIVYTWLELTSFLGATPSRVLSSVLPGTYTVAYKKLKMKLLPHQDFNPKSEEKFFLKKGKIISWAELFKAGLR